MIIIKKVLPLGVFFITEINMNNKINFSQRVVINYEGGLCSLRTCNNHEYIFLMNTRVKKCKNLLTQNIECKDGKYI